MLSSVQRFFSLIWDVIIVLLVPIAILSMIGMPIYDHLFPDEKALSLIEDARAEGVRILIGVRSSEERLNDLVVGGHTVKSFIFLPSFIYTFDVYVYARQFGKEDKLKIKDYGGFSVVFSAFLLLILFVLFSIKRIRELGLSLFKWEN